MSLKLIKGTAFYTLGNILPQAVGFFLLPVYTFYLSPTEYGLVNSMNVLNGIFMIFFTLALDRGVNRLYYDFKTDENKRDYLGTITIGLAIISTLFLILFFLFKGIVGSIYKSIDFYPFYSLMILAVYLRTFTTVPSIYLRISEKANVFVLIAFIHFMVVVGLNLIFIIILKKGAEGMLLGQLVGNAIMLPVYIIISFRIVNFKFDYKIFKDSIRFSIPLLPAVLMTWVLNLSDRIFIERYLNLNDVGIYSLGYRIAGLTGILAGGFFTAYNPLFYKIANEEDEVAAKRKLYRLNNVFLLIVLILSFLVVFISEDVIAIFIPEQYHSAFHVIPFITLGYFFSQSAGLFNLMIYQKKKSNIILLITLICAALNIALNFILVPSYGLSGAAYSTCLSFLFMFIIEYFFARLYYFIPINWHLLMPWFIGLVLAFLIFNQIKLENPILNLIMRFSFLLILSVILYCNYKNSIISMLHKQND